MQESYEFMKILSIDDARKFADKKVVVIITGVTGQDGSFMSDFLLNNTEYEIFGGARRLSVSNHENIAHIDGEKRFHLINFDLTDDHSISQTISWLKPKFFINFAAQSFVKSSWDFPAQTWNTNTLSIIHILEAIRIHCPECRFYNAGSSEEFGDVVYAPQDEKHPLRPRSPYGASKAAARQLVKVYRESYGLYAIQGWLFNHEGTRRGEEFVTRKITKAVAQIKKKIVDSHRGPLPLKIVPLELGNLNAKRDWTDAEDCVQAVWRMLNQEKYNPSFPPIEFSGQNGCYTKATYNTVVKEKWFPFIAEYVVSSGENHTVKEFVAEAFGAAGIRGHWEGEKEKERFISDTMGLSEDVLVQINPSYYRPAEIEVLLGNPAKIVTELGWKSTTTFKQLVKKMVNKDLQLIGL
jgi:GDPmannose 4,6-dehydratase